MDLWPCLSWRKLPGLDELDIGLVEASVSVLLLPPCFLPLVSGLVSFVMK